MCDDAVGRDRLCLTDVHKELFQKQAREVKQRVVDSICSVTSNRIDLVEACCPYGIRR